MAPRHKHNCGKPLQQCLVVFVVLSMLHPCSADAASESEALLKFKAALSNAGALSDWNPSTSPCTTNVANWMGVACAAGSINRLQLEGMGLKGTVDVDSLTKLPSLRSISFMNNSLDGSFPDLKKLPALKTIYLSHNRFSGNIPDNAFEGMLNLKKLYLAHNALAGRIPNSLGKLTKLVELDLQSNKFEGELPTFESKDWKIFNVANNALRGTIPEYLRKLNATSFTGNKNMCGNPLPQCSSSLNSTADSNSSSESKQSVVKIVCIVVGSLMVLAAIVAGIILFLQRRRNRKDSDYLPETAAAAAPASNEAAPSLDQMEKGCVESVSTGGTAAKKAGENNVNNNNGKQLCFLRDDGERFDLQDLLKASAEILGSGYFGSSYKTNLLSGSMVVVKRFKQMNNVGKEEFQEHMRRLGRLNHPNLLPLLAYYYRKEEKLMVANYVNKGSLAVHLHGNRNRDKPVLNWLTRLKIVKGVARGLAYLYKELPSLITPHGHLKSSNVLLDDSFEPLLNDYGLVPVVNLEHAQQLMAAYKSPEHTQHGRITKKTDVWSLGILILEILTAKFPASYLQQGKGDKGSDLVNWVSSVAEQDRSEVFDNEMGAKDEGQMLELLKIALACCETDADKRWDLKETVDRIEKLKEIGNGEADADV